MLQIETTALPHGRDSLVDRTVSTEERVEAGRRAEVLPRVQLSPHQLADLELIATGALTPLSGFMAKSDYQSVLHHMALTNGVAWSLPITLSTSAAVAQGLKDGQELALAVGEQIVGLLELQERYQYDKSEEASRVYGTTDLKHPGVANLFDQGDVLLAGPVWLLKPPATRVASRDNYQLTPAQARAEFAARGWRTVVGFQTRNPIHRAHEYIQKCALEIVDGLFLHPLVGATKSDDVDADTRMASYETLVDNYYPLDRVLLSTFPAAMRYAGPREAVFHALVRKNYGCTHFVVGRDHAGVGNYYGTYDAQLIFRQFEPADLGITPLFFDHAFYCRRCAGMVTKKTCPHPTEEHVILSGTKVRELLQGGCPPPPEFTRPEVAEVLLRHRNGANRPGSGTDPGERRVHD